MFLFSKHCGPAAATVNHYSGCALYHLSDCIISTMPHRPAGRHRSGRQHKLSAQSLRFRALQLFGSNRGNSMLLPQQRLYSMCLARPLAGHAALAFRQHNKQQKGRSTQTRVKLKTQKRQNNMHTTCSATALPDAKLQWQAALSCSTALAANRRQHREPPHRTEESATSGGKSSGSAPSWFASL